MFYTSGTTGHPEGRRRYPPKRRHQPDEPLLRRVARHAALRRRQPRRDGREHPERRPLERAALSRDRLSRTMITNTASGGKLVMMHHFDAGQALALIESERLTSSAACPPIAMQILDHPDFAKFDTSSVKSVSYGGAPAPPELVRRIQAAFPGGQPGNGYGLTETSAAVCLNGGPDYVEKPESCGPPVPVVGDRDRPRGLRRRRTDARSPARPRRRRRTVDQRPQRRARATGTSPRRPPSPSPRGGCAVATSRASTTRASSSSSTAPRT